MTKKKLNNVRSLQDAICKWDAKTADALARKLKRAGFKGIKQRSDLCPLAAALSSEGLKDLRVTGSRVLLPACDFRENLSQVQVEFVALFDDGEYPFLEQSSE